MRGNSNRLLIALLALTLVLAVASTSQAAVIFEGGGWRISVADNTANPVTIVQDEGNDGTLVLEIFKDFLQPFGPGNHLPSIFMTFEQIAPNALTASKIVINDESIYNGTGTTWTGFLWVLQGADGVATFNQDETYPAGQAGFSTAPFTIHEWHEQLLIARGGTLASGDSFNPGYTGALVIDVDLNASYRTSFGLKEIPGPEPVTMSLLAIGGLCIAMRRRP
jgi:hypothetical protein